MAIVGAWTATAVLAALAVVQLGAAAGRPWGRVLWGGGHEVLPGRLRRASVVVVVLYAGFAALLLSRAGVLPGGSRAVVVMGAWALCAFFVLGIAANAASRSPAERRVMTPVNVVLAAATLLVVLT